MPCIASYTHDRLLRTKYWLHVLRSAYNLSSSHLCNDEQTIHTVWTAHGVNDCGLLWTYNYTENSDLMRYVQPIPTNFEPSLTSFPAWNCRAYALQLLRSLYWHLTDWHSSDLAFHVTWPCLNGTYPDPQHHSLSLVMSTSSLQFYWRIIHKHENQNLWIWLALSEAYSLQSRAFANYSSR
jgi:hypothetical protein